MEKLSQLVSRLYQRSPDLSGVDALSASGIASGVLLGTSYENESLSEQMSFVAGIKCASALEGFDELDTTDFASLKKSAAAAGYDIEIIG